VSAALLTLLPGPASGQGRAAGTGGDGPAGALAAAPRAQVAPEAQSAPGRYLSAARDVGVWLQSLGSGDGPVPDDALRPGTSASLAEGEAGVALFLHELALATGDPRTERAAARAADRLVARLPVEMAREGFPPSTGLYYGAPGVALALLRRHETTADPRHLAAVSDVVDWLVSREGPSTAPGWSDFNDVLFGDAGTALFLLAATDALDRDDARARAIDAGHALIARARPEHGGLAWVLREGGDSNLPNFSHGAAGVGFLMARLYEETGEPAFLEAALGAATYLEAISRDGDGVHVPYGFDPPEWRDRHELGWGHGVAGTARLHAQLARVSDDPRWGERLRAAARAVLAADLPADLALDRRFGLAGIADFMLDVASAEGGAEAPGRSGRAADDAVGVGRQLAGEALAVARELADSILARADHDAPGLHWQQPRPSFMSDAGDPGALTGLLHGAAGYGLLMLRFDAALGARPWTLGLPDSPFGSAPRRALTPTRGPPPDRHARPAGQAARRPPWPRRAARLRCPRR
jgi:hypothetical protein